MGTARRVRTGSRIPESPWPGVRLWRRSLLASTALHIVAIAVVSVSLPARSRPMSPPVFYVSLLATVEEPRPAPEPEVREPQKKTPSPVKVKAEAPKEVPAKKPKEKKTPATKPEQKPPPRPHPAEERDEDLQIRTDQPAFAFDYYLESVRRKISSNWRPPAGTAAGEETGLVLHFRILRDGTVLGPAVETSSGLDLLDHSALRAVLDSAPLPPLPPAYDGPWLGIHLRFVRHD